MKPENNHAMILFLSYLFKISFPPVISLPHNYLFKLALLATLLMEIFIAIHNRIEHRISDQSSLRPPAVASKKMPLT